MPNIEIIPDIRCPKCGHNDIGPWTKTPKRYICRKCFHTFQHKIEPISQGWDVTQIDPPLDVSVIKTDKTLVALFDAHLEPQVQNHPSFEIGMRFVQDLEPDIIVVGGDWMEMGSLSAWDRKKRYLIEGKRYSLEIEQGWTELARLREFCPDARIIFFEGNHEYRTPRYLEEHAEMVGQLDVQKDLKLDDMGIEWVGFNKMIKIGKLNFLHGIFYNIYYARSTLQAVGESCLFGHAHKSQVWTQQLQVQQKPHIAQGIGCLCTINPTWKRGMPTNFINSFAIVEFRANGDFNIQEVIVADGAASHGGRTWQIPT